MVVIFMIGTPFAPIPLSQICLDRLWPPEVGQIANHQEEFLI